MSFLDIRNLKKMYGKTQVLHGINIQIEKSAFLVLVGPSGCGKSTLLNAISGLTAISEGDIFIDNVRVNDLHPSKRDIAMVFQSYALYPNMKVRQNISFALEMQRLPKEEIKQRTDKVARMLQIEHLLDRKPRQLSGGQRQRVAMGRALVRDPQLFLFDEPLSNLDAKLRVEMRTEIKKLHRKLGSTIVYVTHDQIEAMTLADHIAVMYDGKIQQFGSPHDIYHHPANMFVAGFMGAPSMNFIRTVVTRSADGYDIEIADRNRHVKLPVLNQTHKLETYDGKPVILGLRPESITELGVTSHQNPRCQIECHVEVVEPAGSDTFVVLPFGAKEVIARVQSENQIRAGEPAMFYFNMAKAVLFNPDTEERIV